MVKINADESDPRRVALAFLAHPDDAEILCGGTLLRLSDLGWAIHVITASPGDMGAVDLSPDEIADVRRREAAAAADVLGGSYRCLEERDVRVTFRRESIDKAIDAFREINPTLVFTHPRHDYMLDHEQTHLLARAAAFSFPIPHASALPLGEGARIPHLYYIDPIEGLDPYSGEPVTPTTVVDISAVLDRKVEALTCHASQREWLRSHHGMDHYVESMRAHSASRGELIGTAAGEAFIQHRGHAFPADDLLGDVLGAVAPA